MRIFRDLQAVLTLLCGMFLVLGFFGLHPAIPYVSVVFGSYFALRSAYESLAERSIDVNFLMVFAAAGAVALGAPMDAAALLFLFSLSSTLEEFAMARTKSAIEGLIKLRPDVAIRVTDRGDQEIPVASLAVGDLVRVLPFNQIPTDAVVESGTSEVNEAAMTGESVPVNKFAGDRILAGTQNLSGMFVARVTAASGETTLEKIVNLVSEAQENKASGERISVWFGQRYTFFVVAAFAVSLGVRFLAGQQTHDAFYGALTLLVALSPCAVVISTPATTLSALAWAARHGMLIRGGEFIELAGRIDAIALDKTGTLTTGRPELVEICVCERVPAGAAVAVRLGDACNDDGCWHGTPQMSPAATHILQFAAAAEQYSTHPIAEAITEAARARQIAVPEATQQQAHSGLGVEAIIEGVRVRVGQRRFFETQHDQFEPEFATKIERMQQKGMTVAVLEVEGRLAALGLRDHVRGESFAVVRELEELGVNPIAILTGDTAQTAGAVAEEVKVSEVHAGLMPDDKTALIEQWTTSGRQVMMVGDGINDAPSLARASVGVAMGGLGSDITLNAADVVLMQDKLVRIPELIRLGRATNNIIKANLFFATGVIVTLTLLSVFWRLPLPLAVLGHEGSTVLVILNGLRLLRGPKRSAA